MMWLAQTIAYWEQKWIYQKKWRCHIWGIVSTQHHIACVLTEIMWWPFLVPSQESNDGFHFFLLHFGTCMATFMLIWSRWSMPAASEELTRISGIRSKETAADSLTGNWNITTNAQVLFDNTSTETLVETTLSEDRSSRPLNSPWQSWSWALD